ncbi:MAG TPA: hypothetical protein VGB36_01545, partial [Gammaproteobacteria bacterium]
MTVNFMPPSAWSDQLIISRTPKNRFAIRLRNKLIQYSVSVDINIIVQFSPTSARSLFRLQGKLTVPGPSDSALDTNISAPAAFPAFSQVQTPDLQHDGALNENMGLSTD